MKLTQAKIAKLNYTRVSEKGKSAEIYWDDDLPGFGIRVYPSGKKTFVVTYRNAVRQKRWMTIGHYPVLTLKEARQKARKTLTEVLDGKDPLAEKEKVIAGEKVSDLCSAYIERHAKQRKKTWKTDEARIKNHIIPVWKNRLVASITRQDVAKLHDRIGRKTPYEANRTIQLISKIWNLAENWGYLTEGSSNPTKGIELFKEIQRERWMKPTEINRMINALVEEPSIYIRAVILLYLYTGVRKSELLRAKWSDVDFDSDELYLPETKSGKPKTAQLSNAAISVLKKLPQIKNNPYIFPSPRKPNSHYVNIDKAWRRVRKKADIEDVTIHDLRRTLGSLMVQEGATLQVVGDVLHHESIKTTLIYARLGTDPIKKAVSSYGENLANSISNGDPEIMEDLLRLEDKANDGE
jgi:integrase